MNFEKKYSEKITYMKIALAILILLHALIHLPGAIKSVRPLMFPQLKASITPLYGVFWLTTTLLFVAAFVLVAMHSRAWWMPAAAGVVLSQCLVLTTWRDAKFGTLPNVVILAAVAAGGAAWNFHRTYTVDAEKLLTQAVPGSLLTEADIQQLPAPVQKYIRCTHALNKPKVSSFRVEFSGRIRDYEKKEWMEFASVQHSFQNASARLFFLDATMKSLPVAGYHRYGIGNAFMDIRLFSLFTVQYESGGAMDTAETVTFFNDMCVMAPATLIDPRIVWTPVDDLRTDASFTNNGITVSASLYFNAQGELINFVSNDRFARQTDGSMKRLTWSTPLSNYREISGMYLASDAQAVYAYPDGEFCYGEFHLVSVEYNPSEIR
jgi:hypothetical protein